MSLLLVGSNLGVIAEKNMIFIKESIDSAVWRGECLKVSEIEAYYKKH